MLGRPAKEVSSVVWMEELVIVTAELVLAPSTSQGRLNVLKMKSSVSQHFFLLFLW